METIKCKTCCEEKTLDAFSVSPLGKVKKACLACDKVRLQRNRDKCAAKNQYHLKIVVQGDRTCKTCNLFKMAEDFPQKKGQESNVCRVCKAAENKQYRKDNAERIRVIQAAWSRANKEKVKAFKKAWAVRNKEAVAEYGSNWGKANRDKTAAYCAGHRAAKITATPSWSNKTKMDSFYESADALNMLTGEWHHVDHIVPLNSDMVCGLHCEQNLQILPKIENLKKSNIWWPDMWEPLDAERVL